MTAILLEQLSTFLQELNDSDYSKPSIALSKATIGQHVRHSIEMYQLLLQGSNLSIIDYSLRKRELLLENSLPYALECIQHIIKEVEATNDRPLMVANDNNAPLASSFGRELLYCNEHTIHHMALIRVAVNEIGGYQLNESFGVAPSTIEYRRACVQ